ncbi:MAG: response regulator [Deltaproteobacteria bacterium]|nr:response regulator [Deltaproteobacteria bacterium]
MKKLLVIDDEASTRDLLKMSLESDGYTVFVAEDGPKGLEIFARENPPVVLTDIKMPGMDGIEVLRRVKEKSPDTEVIVITGHGEMNLAVQALHLEASDFINKPISDEGLSVALRRAEEKIWLREKLKEYTEDLEKIIQETNKELVKRHELEHNIIQTSMDGIIANDRQGKIIIFNEGAERIYGYTREEALSKIHVTQLYPEGQAKQIKKMIYGDEYGGSGRLINYSVEALTQTGELVPILLSATIIDEKGEEVATVGHFKDMREIKRLEDELLTSERMATVGQTTAGIAHGVKNILHGMKLGAFMIDTGFDKDKPESLRKGWNLVRKNINRVSKMTKEMLSLASTAPPAFEVCSLNEIVEEVCELLAEEISRRGISLVLELDPSLPQVTVDPDGIHTCLLNLVTNAIEAFPEDTSGGQVTVSSRDEGEAGVHLQVRDSGEGMSEELLERVLENLFTTKGARGTGLGLAITQKIVHEHGGTIQVESEPKKGTCFTIILPE